MSAVKTTALIGFLGLGVGVNLFGTYYVLASSGALPDSLTPPHLVAKREEAAAEAERAAAEAAAAAMSGQPASGGRRRWWKVW